MTKPVMLMLSAITTGCLLSAQGVAQAQSAAGSAWVPYSAQFTETITTWSQSSPNRTTKQSLIEEKRSKDGSLLSVRSENGHVTSGTLWKSCGQILSLDYIGKRAIPSRQAPRVHTKLPSTTPTGSRIIAGVQCVTYPILHLQGGSGTICHDMADDLPVLFEMHTVFNGTHQDYVKQLVLIDLGSDPGSVVGVPEGFTELAAPSGSPLSCGAKK